jgi:MFS transporter, PPP family, 3-phenylpropionic acid transporter
MELDFSGAGRSGLNKATRKIVSIPTTNPARDLRLIRLYYLFWLGGGGFLYPYITLFYKQQGLTGTEIGLLSTVGWGVALLAAPVWARRGDNVRNPRPLIQLGLVSAALLISWLSQQTAFLWMAAIIALNSLIGSASDPLSTSQALAITNNQKSGFGSIRVWGSIGWVIMTPLAGWLIERLGQISSFAGYAISNILSALVLVFITTNPPAKKADAAPQPRMGTVIGQLSRDRSMVGLAVALFIFWLTSYGATQFESLYLKQLAASTFVIGLVNTTSAVIEIGGMVWADRLVRRYGAGRILGISMLVYAVAKLIVIASPSIPAIFAMRALNGIYYSMFVVGSISYAAEGAPHGQGSTVMAFYFITMQGLTQLVAGPLGGAAFDTLGAYWLFVIACGGALLSWLVLRFTERPQPDPAPSPGPA